MAKKSSKKAPLFPSSITAGTLAVVLTFFIVTFAVYLAQKASLKSAEEEYDNEVKIMENQVADIKGKVVKNEVKKPTNVEIEVSTGPDVEFAFEKCGFLSNFIYEDWYPKLKTNLDKLNIQPKSISSSCHSTKGNMIVFITQTGKDCEGPKVYKFKTDTSTFGLAKVISKGAACLSPLDVFGTRDKHIIDVTGQRSVKGCIYKDYFEYNYGKNTVELTQIRYRCEGSTEWKSTVY